MWSRIDRAISILEREGAPRPGVTQDLAAREGLIPRLGPGLTPPCFFCPHCLHFGPDVMLTGEESHQQVGLERVAEVGEVVMVVFNIKMHSSVIQ